jgi:hypothetical protein
MSTGERAPLSPSQYLAASEARRLQMIERPGARREEGIHPLTGAGRLPTVKSYIPIVPLVLINMYDNRFSRRFEASSPLAFRMWRSKCL